MSLPKTAVVGVRGFATMYVRHFVRLQDAGRIDWAAAVVRSPEKAPEEVAMLKSRGVRIFPDTASMYDAIPDLALVGLPVGIEFHEPMTCEALSRGVNVLVEKPVSTTVASVDRMIAAANAHPGLSVTVGFQHMADRNIRLIKQTILSGRLGRIQSIRFHGFWPRGDAYYGRNNWAGKIASPSTGALILDSPANNAFAHYLNIALFLAADKLEATAEPTVTAARLLRARRSIETFDTCAIDFTAGGVPVSAFLTHTCLDTTEPHIVVQCSEGRADWELNGEWSIRDANGDLIAGGPDGDCYGTMFDDVVAKLADPSVFTCSVAMARNHAALIEALYRDYQVEEIPEALIHRRESDGQLYVDGLLDYGRECSSRGVANAGPFPR